MLMTSVTNVRRQHRFELNQRYFSRANRAKSDSKAATFLVKSEVFGGEYMAYA